MGCDGANALEKPCKPLSYQLKIRMPHPLSRVMQQTKLVKFCAQSTHAA